MKKSILIILFLSLCSLSYLYFKDDIKRYFKWNYYLEQTKNDVELQEIHQKAKDTIGRWIDLNLHFWSFKDGNIIEYKWKLLPYVYLNSSRNYCVLYCPIQQQKRCVCLDRLKVILGEKINGEWWFYPGMSYAISRRSYSRDPLAPVSFKKLEELSIEEAMRYYYNKVSKPFGSCIKKLLTLDFSGYWQCLQPEYEINDKPFEHVNWDICRKDYPEFLEDVYEED